jgi:tyrosyl-tRNA synthetase
MRSPEEQCEILRRGAAQILSEAELLQKLRLKRPLNVKLGVDPTAPDIHLGFTVALEKLRQFQDLGHQAILIIGDFTAMIGDPSGRSKTRPQLSHDQVMANAKSFQEQAFKILDPQRTRTVFNGEWFEIMTFEQVMRLNGRVTLQQMLQREDFRGRVDRGEPVHLHEIQYPIMQGWDSVMIKADVELGGTDQLFNILVGRDVVKRDLGKIGVREIAFAESQMKIRKSCLRRVGAVITRHHTRAELLLRLHRMAGRRFFAEQQRIITPH